MAIDRDRFAEAVSKRPERVDASERERRRGKLLSVWDATSKLLNKAGVPTEIINQPLSPGMEDSSIKILVLNRGSAHGRDLVVRYNGAAGVEVAEIDHMGLLYDLEYSPLRGVRWDRVSEDWVGVWLPDERRFENAACCLARVVVELIDR